jgi:hypothetical protein
MHSKYNELEATIEDLVEHTIVPFFQDTLASKKECIIALEMLKEQLEEFDCSVFDDFF